MPYHHGLHYIHQMHLSKATYQLSVDYQLLQGHSPLEQLRVKFHAQGHNDGSRYSDLLALVARFLNRYCAIAF